MLRLPFFLTAVVLAFTAAAAAVQAQDRLESILVKPKLSAQDRATIEAEVSMRAKRLADAGTDTDRRARCRDGIVNTSRAKGATKNGLDVYAEVCGAELRTLAATGSFEVSSDAVAVLIDLNNAGAAEALAQALKSEHAATRLRAVRGLERLKDKLAGNERVVRRSLLALGEAGACEANQYVLRAIYECIGVLAEAKNAQMANDGARAVGIVFEGRLKRMDAGGREPIIDQIAFNTAAACYPSAAAEEQGKLAERIARFLEHAVNRYIDPSTARGHLPVLAGLIKDAEQKLHMMIRTSKMNVPSRQISDILKGKNPTAKDEQEARAILGELIAVVKVGS